MEQSHNKLISAIIGVIVLALIVVGLVWLSDNANYLAKFSSNMATTTTQSPSPDEVAQILKDLSKPVLGPDGKPVATPTPEETQAVLKQLSKSSSSGKKPTPAEVAEVLKQLQTSQQQ